ESVQRASPDAGVRDSVHTSLAEIDRLAEMTERMLLISKLDNPRSSLALESIRLDELLIESIQFVKALATQKKIGITLFIAEAIEMRGDRQQLKSVFLNLLDNALKYTDDGGTISVSLLNGDRAEQCSYVKVEDSGSGITPGDLPHIFERFYRSANVR